MKLKFEPWRNAVVKHLFENGPMVLSRINRELKTKEGMPYKALPTTNQCAMVLKCDKRIKVRVVDRKGFQLNGSKIYEYAADIDVLKEIGWERW
tara:strand:- start:408 stop:689 length:282 start_codon:yes stop_codon:yes gene_type:complete